MPIIAIQGFKGGQAVDIYDSLQKQTFQKAYDLDIYTDKNVLAPVPLKLQSMALPDIGGQTSERVFNSYLASDGKYYFIGDATISAANNLVIWSVDTLGASPTWTSRVAIPTADPWRLLEEYKDCLFFGYGTTLARYGNLSSSPSVTTIGSVTNGITQLRNHRGLGMIYFAHNSGKTIGRYDNSTFSATRLTLDQGDVCVGLEEYGRWVIVGVRGAGSKKDRFLMWDGAATTVDDILYTNSTGLQGFRIIGGVIEYIATSSNGASDFIDLVQMAPGKSPRLIRKDIVKLSSGTNTVPVNAITTFESTLMYGLDGEAYTDYPLGIFAHGTPTESVARYWALHRLVHTGATTNVSVSSIKNNGSSLVVTWGTSAGGVGTQYINILTGDGITPGASAYGEYETNIFPLSEVPGLAGKIKRIVMNHYPLPTGAGFTVQVKHYGHYPWGNSVPSEDSYVDLTTPEGSGGATGKTQSTTNATITEIAGHENFKTARYGQLKIKYDEVSTVNYPSIVFPLLVETT